MFILYAFSFQNLFYSQMFYVSSYRNDLFYSLLLFQLRGEAEAFAIEAKAKAEAEQMAKKADAFKEYRDAAMVDMVLDTLPKVTS